MLQLLAFCVCIRRIAVWILQGALNNKTHKAALIALICSCYPSIHPIFSAPPLCPASLECQAPPWLFQQREGLWTAAKHSPRFDPAKHKHKDALSMSQIFIRKHCSFGQLPLVFPLTWDVSVFPPFLTVRPRWTRGSSATLQSTYASWAPFCRCRAPVGMEIKR